MVKKAKYIIKDQEYYLNDDIKVSELQKVVLDIMIEIDRICKKNNIPYALHAGSALGAYNYGGFIPWDDDMDIIIPNEYYNQFINALQKDLNPKYDFQCYETDKNYDVFINNIKVRNKNTYIVEKSIPKKNRCSGSQGVFVDIIRMDNASENKFIDELYRFIIRFLRFLSWVFDEIGINPKAIKDRASKISKNYSNKNKNSSLCSQTICYTWVKFLHEPVFKKSDIYPFRKCDFEGHEFYTYNHPKKVLSSWYGPNSIKKWNGTKYINLYPNWKRVPKHIYYLNLKSNKEKKLFD